jgi:hypothetical protein
MKALAFSAVVFFLAILLFLLVLLSARPSFAQTDFRRWGSSFPETSSSVRMQPGTDGAVFDVICVNKITGGHDKGLRLELTRDGVTIVVFVFSQDGDAPDTYLVAAPAGYFADPEEITVEEHQTGVIRVYLEAGA